MKKRLLALVLAVAFSIGLMATAYAASPIKLVFNGRELSTDVQPQLVDGRLLVPLRIISESLGAKVAWETKTNTVVVEAVEAKKNPSQDSRISRLEQALAPKDAMSAAKTWAEGVKTRNGALQYAVMSEELKNEVYQNFVESNWSTGVSSPWIETYDVKIKDDNADSDVIKFAVSFTYTDSTQATFTETEFITVEKYNEHWFVSSIEQIGVRGKITRIITDENNQITGILIEGQDEEDTLYDKANASITEQTKIYEQASGAPLSVNDLQEGMLVEAIFEGPVLFSYPVQAGAKTISVL